MPNQKKPVTTYCGRPITSQELTEIRETVETFGNLSRKELIHTICEHLNWRTPSGTNKWDACLKMLMSFEAQGHFTLPAKKNIAKPAPTRIRHTAETAPGPPVNSTLKQIRPVKLTQPATTSEVRLWNEYMDRYHYLGYKKPIGYRLRYFIRTADTVLGCILFSGAARAITSRDKWIGWSASQRTAGLPWVVNNTRFLIFPWVRVPYLASHILGKSGRPHTPVTGKTNGDTAPYFWKLLWILSVTGGPATWLPTGSCWAEPQARGSYDKTKPTPPTPNWCLPIPYRLISEPDCAKTDFAPKARSPFQNRTTHPGSSPVIFHRPAREKFHEENRPGSRRRL